MAQTGWENPRPGTGIPWDSKWRQYGSRVRVMEPEFLRKRVVEEHLKAARDWEVNPQVWRNVKEGSSRDKDI